MDNLLITIPVRTDMDMAQVLSIAQELAERLRDEIESYGEEVEIDEEDVSVAMEEE